MFAKVVDMSKSPILEIRRGSPWGCCGYPAVPKRKKPTWRNTLRYSTTSAYSPTSLSAQPSCSSSSHPTTANQLVTEPCSNSPRLSTIRSIGPRNGQSKWMSGSACPATAMIPVTVGTSIVFLALLGGSGAHAGSAPVTKAAMRVTFWGVLAMAPHGGSGRSVRSGYLKFRLVQPFTRFAVASVRSFSDFALMDVLPLTRRHRRRAAA